MEKKTTYIDRTEAFAQMAQRVARGEVLVPPDLLPPEERRLHIRQTLREDHHFRIKDEPEELQLKFDKMRASPFVFFRGTALLFFRDLAGMDVHLPWVLCNGDVHPENFGVMPSADGEPFFGLNDFDEAAFAPFTWDLRRAVVAFHLAAKDNGISCKKARKIAAKFLAGYLDALKEFSETDAELTHQYRYDNSPPIIQELIGKAAQKTRERFLRKWCDIGSGRFRPQAELIPMTDEIPRFQDALAEYVARDGKDVPERGKDHFKVKDVAQKKGSGTASLGLPRYYVLIEGPGGGLADDILLEVKMSTQSVLTGLVPVSGESANRVEASRVVESHRVHLVGGDPYYGHLTLGGQSFLVREKSPYKKSVKLAKLDAKGFRKYAATCGYVLAQAHARSDADTGVGRGSAEHEILDAIDRDLFVDDLVRFAQAGSDRVQRDHAHYVEDYDAGGFRYLEAAAS